MNPSIPVFSSQKRFSNMVSENQARSMLSAGTHDLVRSRSGNVRMLYERTSVAFGQPGEDHFRWRGKMSGGFSVMQAERLGFEQMALAKGAGT
jgi:hypothetical protein